MPVFVRIYGFVSLLFVAMVVSVCLLLAIAAVFRPAGLLP